MNQDRIKLRRDRYAIEPKADRYRTATEPMLNRDRRMELRPETAPGRKTRKARAFTTEIQRLADQGYSLAQIRDVLQAAGLTVSKSTVRREAGRRAHSTTLPGRARLRAQAPAKLATATEPHADAHTSAVRPRRLSDGIAEAFFQEHPSTPLLPSQEVP